jgi:hypothetical protein
MISTRRLGNLAVRILCILVSVLALPIVALAASDPPEPPSGLVVVLENKPEEGQLDLRVLNNPNIRGVALQIRWRDIEPVQGQPNWSKLDQLFAAAESSNKWVQLLIFPGFFLRRGPWKAYGLSRFRFSTDQAEVRLKDFPCPGIGCIWATGLIS